MKENLSIQHLHDLLTGDNISLSSLKNDITLLTEEWTEEDGRFAVLKILRNKLLSHNDFAEHVILEPNQLWINMSLSDFETAKVLASRLWALYRECNRVIRDTDVAEPNYSRLDYRPSILLNLLSDSKYLDHMITNSIEHLDKRLELRGLHVGKDSVRRVFSD